MSSGQLVIGPPGAGKTVYCCGMQQFLNGLKRKTIVVNLDPANDIELPYQCSINICDLISVEHVMDCQQLGPNGGMLYALEYLEKNILWLKERLEKYSDSYVIFDCPGQVEIYTHHHILKNIVRHLSKWNCRLTAVHLVDSRVCTDAGVYIAALLVSLNAMLELELPHVNVLSKIDLLRTYGSLDFHLDFYTDVIDLRKVLQYLHEDSQSDSRFFKLNEVISELIEDFGLVSFQPLNIQDKEDMNKLLRNIDKANGYIFGGLTSGNESIMDIAESVTDWEYNRVAAVEDKYRDLEFDLQE